MKRGKNMYNQNYYPFNYPRKFGFFSNFKNMKWSTILDGTQKTLSIINQAIPVIYQIKPIYQNAKTVFKVAKELNKDDIKTVNKKENIRKATISSNNPTYFL